tara:strand:+ start:889 stop:1584 length:696 start_codon:yes stop_codon:yes gene_type:complete
MEIILQLPQNVNAITLKDYQRYNKIITENPEAEADFFNIKMLEIFCDLKYKDITSLPIGEFDDTLDYMEEIFREKTPLVRRFNMTGSDGVEIEFGFVPNLDKITMGEYIDLNTYIQEADTLHKAMAVLYRPIHKDYKKKIGYKIDSYKGADLFSDVMKDMPLGIALGAKVFFYRLGIKLSRTILSYSQAMLEDKGLNLSEEEKATLTKNMDGIGNFMQLQEETLLRLMKLH